MLPATLLVSACFAYYKKWHFFFMSLGSVVLTTFITYTLKILLHVPRPITALIIEDGYRFPSGHASIAAIIGCIAIYVAYRAHASRSVRVLVVSLAILWYVLVAWARLYLGVHYLVDVVAGLIVALISFGIVYGVAKRVR